MKAVRALLAVLWLVFGLTTTAHAGPRPDCGMAGMAHHDRQGHALPADMPCCSQPVVVAMPAPLAPAERVAIHVRPAPMPITELTGVSLRLKPRPPKAI